MGLSPEEITEMMRPVRAAQREFDAAARAWNFENPDEGNIRIIAEDAAKNNRVVVKFDERGNPTFSLKGE